MSERMSILLEVNDDGTMVVRNFAQAAEREAKRAATAVQGAFHTASTGAAEMQNAFGALSRHVGATLDGVAKRMANVAKLTATVFTAMAAKKGLDIGTEFQKQMSAVQAVSGATREELARFAAVAQDLGPKFGFSAREAAQAQETLALAGFKTNEIMTLLPSTMTLARAGALDLGRAAGIASDVLRGFGMEAENFGTVVDQLAFTASNTNAEVSDLGESFKFVGAIASSIGARFSEVNAALGVLANQGIRGEMAGTGLTRVLSVLLGQTEEGEKGLAAYNLQLFDSSGRFVGLAEAMDRMKAAGISTQEVMDAFGQRGGPTMLRLMAAGADAVRGLEGSLNGARGAAEKMSATRMDNLAGDLDKLKGAAESLAIAIFDKLAPGLRDTTRDLADLITQFAEFVRTSTFVEGLKTAFTLLAEAVGVLIARNVYMWATNAANAIGGLNTALVFSRSTMVGYTAMFGQTAAAARTLSVGLNAATASAVGLTAATAVASYQMTRMVMEMLGWDKHVESFFSGMLRGMDDVRAETLSFEQALSTIRRTAASRGSVSAIPGLENADEDLAKLQRIREEIERLKKSGTYIPQGFGAPLNTNQPQIDKLTASMKEVEDRILSAGRALDKFNADATRLIREHPKEWQLAAEATTDYAERVRLVGKLIEEAQAKAKGAAAANEAAAAARKAATEAEIRAQQSAAREAHRALANVGFMTRAAAAEFEANWARMRQAIGNVPLAPVMEAWAKDLVSYADGVERSGAKIADALRRDVTAAREYVAAEEDRQKAIEASRAAQERWRETARDVDAATGISAEAVGKLRNQYDALSKEIGEARAVAILAEEFVKLGDAARVRGWDLGPVFASLEGAAVASERSRELAREAREQLESVAQAAGSITPAGLIEFQDRLAALYQAAEEAGIPTQVIIAGMADELLRVSAAAEQSGQALNKATADAAKAAQRIQTVKATWSALGGVVDIVRQGFSQAGAAMLTAAIAGGKANVSFGALLATMSQQCFATAIMELAAGIAASSGPWGAAIFGNPAAHFKAAIVFGAAGAALGVASRVMGGPGGEDSSSSGSTKSGSTPALAEGGLTRGPVRALIGEAGPEAVVPLRGPNARRVAEEMGITRAQAPTVVQEITVNVTTGHVLTEKVPRALAEKVRDALSDMIGSGQLRPLPTGAR